MKRVLESCQNLMLAREAERLIVEGGEKFEWKPRWESISMVAALS